MLPSVITGNGPMQYVQAGSQNPNIGIGSSRALW